MLADVTRNQQLSVDDTAIRYPPTWARESVTWAKRRGLTQVEIGLIDAELKQFRQKAAENRERERPQTDAFEAWWAEHGEEREHMYDGLRALEVGRTVEPERKEKR